VKEFPVLYHKARKGDLRQWRVWADGDRVWTEWGSVGGQLLISNYQTEGKNIGKANETTPEQQAESEAQALWTYKVERKYKESVAETEEILNLPMLAKDFDPKKLVFPCLAQPKLDGVRCLAQWEDGRIVLTSRGGKEWTEVPHINEELAKILPKDHMLDGELYVHGMSLQNITRLVKKNRPETVQVQYHVYDMPVVCGGDFDQYGRHLALYALFGFVYPPDKPKTPHIVKCPTTVIHNQEELDQFEEQCLADGYEGAIARNYMGLYQFGYRSSDLQKIKQFLDGEFLVVGCKQGVGKFEGCAIFQCKNDTNDLTFECVAPGTLADKAQYWADHDGYIGKWLKVKYARERTNDGLPKFPVGVAFRLPEDM